MVAKRKKKGVRGKARKGMHRNRPNKRGSLRFEINLPGIGKLRRSSGTTNRDLFNQYRVLIKPTLYEKPEQWPRLKDLIDGRITMQELWALHTSRQLYTKDDPKTLEPIDPTILDYLDGYRGKRAPTTRKNYRNQIENFLTVVPGTTLIKNLPVALGTTFYDYCDQHDYHRKYNLVKDILSGYLRKTFGDDHTVYKQIRKTVSFPHKRKTRTKALTVPQLWILLRDLPEPHASIAATLAFCGLHTKELWVDGIEVDTPYSVEIFGQKTEYRHRRIPKVYDVVIPEPVIKPSVTVQGFREALNKCSEAMPGLGHRTPKDLRGTFRRLCQAARIEPNRVDVYGGWNDESTVPSGYTTHVARGDQQYEEYLEEDRDAIKAEIRKQLRKAGLAVTDVLKPQEMPDEEREAYGDDLG